MRVTLLKQDMHRSAYQAGQPGQSGCEHGLLPAGDGEDMKGHPTMGDVAAFDEEMQHELLGAERPGIRSRMSHDLAAFQSTRIQLGVRALHERCA